jgi:SEC-C motif-containing protein
MKFVDDNPAKTAQLMARGEYAKPLIPQNIQGFIPMIELAVTAPCPCTSGKTYGDCCAPIIAGTVKAATAEALMRSRYTAYVVHNIDHVERTDHPERRESFDRKSAEQWATMSEWIGLDVVTVEKGGVNDTTGAVEFRARFSIKGQEHQHVERSSFAKVDGTWYYVEGSRPEQKPFVHEAPVVGRNDPCSCGSGKKFKKCCGK